MTFRCILPISIGLAILAIFIITARQARDTTATSDTAVIESYTLLAAEAALDVGPYSRFQWHHPGPLAFYLLAPFHQLAGERTTGLSAGALSLNFAALVTIVMVLWRYSSPATALTVAVLLAAYAWRAAEALASPWNPHLPVLPFAALVVTAAAAASGAVVMLPLVALFASLAAQSHVALVPSAMAIGGAALIGLRGQTSAAVRQAVGTTALALAIAWALPLKEQVTAAPGNLTLLWNYFVGEAHAGQSFSVALSSWSDMLTGIVRPDFYVAHGWRYVESPVKWAEMLSIAQLAALLLAAAGAGRNERRFDVNLTGFLVFASLAAFGSAMRAEDPLFDHAVFWISGLGVLTLGVVLGEAIRFVLTYAPFRMSRSWLARGCVAALALAVVAGETELNRQVARSFEEGGEKDTARAIADDLAAYMSANHIVRPVIRIDQDAWGVVAGVVLNLQKRGIPVAVEDDWIAMFSPAFSDTGREEVAITIAAPAEHVRLAAAGAITIASRDPIYAHAVRLMP